MNDGYCSTWAPFCSLSPEPRTLPGPCTLCPLSGEPSPDSTALLPQSGHPQEALTVFLWTHRVSAFDIPGRGATQEVCLKGQEDCPRDEAQASSQDTQCLFQAQNSELQKSFRTRKTLSSPPPLFETRHKRLHGGHFSFPCVQVALSLLHES